MAPEEERTEVTKRKRYSADFKANVALEAIREELTTAELAKKYDIHPTMVSGWKRTAIENMAQAFNGQTTAEPTISAAEVEKLHEPPRVYRRAKLSENCPLWNMHKRRRLRSRIHPSSANARCGWRWNTAMIIKAKLQR
ncbi:transposase [Pararhodobacter sp.]|uniref:transposase n=1 Tax=Pararhodobacter sp. TaxID=2127056 RepID=UPI003A598D4A